MIAESFAAVPLAFGQDSAIVTPRSPGIAIGENSWIGARALLLSGALVGEGAIIGAAAVVDFAVPAGAIVAGNPARVVGWTKDSR